MWGIRCSQLSRRAPLRRQQLPGSPAEGRGPHNDHYMRGVRRRRRAWGYARRVGFVAAAIGTAGVLPAPASATQPGPLQGSAPGIFLGDCNFNGQTSSLIPAHLAVIDTQTGASIAVSCHSLDALNPPPYGVGIGEASPLVAITPAADLQAAVLAMGDPNTGDFLFCAEYIEGCPATWDSSYVVPATFQNGGDPNAVCPPTQQQVNIGLPGCVLATADTNGDLLGGVVLSDSSAPNPEPANPTLALASSSVPAGTSVKVSDVSCTPSASVVCPYWWGDPLSTVPSPGGVKGGLDTPLPAANLAILYCPVAGGTCTGGVENPWNPSLRVTAPAYAFDSSTSTGSISTYPQLAGSITVPTSLSPGSYNVEVFETNLFGIDPGNSTNSLFPNDLEATVPLTVTPATTPVVTAISPMTGSQSGGTTVTISGWNLVASGGTAPTVTFGAAAATSVSCTSATTCTATSPAGQGAVNVSVTAAGQASPANPPSDVFAYLAAPGVYTPVVPTRICDTRPSNPSQLSGAAAQCNGSGSGSPVAPESTVAIQVGGLGPPGSIVPSDATAAVLNVTVVDTTTHGYLTVFPDGSIQAQTSNLNWVKGQNAPNLVEVALPKNGEVDIFNGSQDITNLLVDLLGFVAPAQGTSTAGYFNALTPARICDTRAGNPSNLSGPAAQCDNETMMGGSNLEVSLTNNVGGLPANGIGAVALDVTVFNPNGAGYATVYPTGTSLPTASNLNFAAGQTAANDVVSKVGVDSSGNASISLFVSSGAGSADVTIDVTGWYTDGSQQTAVGETYTAAPPFRICDTRLGDPSGLSGTPLAQCAGTYLTDNALQPGMSRTVQVGGMGIAPLPGTNSPTVLAVVNLTLSGPSSAGSLFAWAGPTPQPSFPVLSWLEPATTFGLVVVALSPNGSITVATELATADILIDISGWYS